MNTLEHLIFILQHAAHNLEKEELMEHIRELSTAFFVDGMYSREDDEAAAMRQLNGAWSERYLPQLEGDYPTLYVIHTNTTGFYKIGHSVAPLGRMRHLQTGNPFQLQIVHEEHGEDEMEAEHLETRVHEILDAHHLRGEWFDCSLERIKEAIEQARAEMYGQTHGTSTP